MKYIKPIALISLFILLVFIYLPDEGNIMPVKNATSKDWNPKSFWYYPWGQSVTHKGVDIFAKEGTQVLSRTRGLVVFSGNNGRGGKSVIVLSNKYRLHYYAHLKSIHAHNYRYIVAGDKIGEVGNTGNAKGKPAHLHYSIFRLIPQPFDWDIHTPQGWKKMFYLNPALETAHES